MGETAFKGLDVGKISLLISTLFQCLLAHVTKSEGPAGQEEFLWKELEIYADWLPL